ncbi:Polycomb protein [Macleaya cordata]|uniref:Polycomb protein n=1 Tax=Macleaya cordata TaxID=56857 RepID=A0A200Q3N2_MACCD|nr:Polycomb protein [Macleaya cordata]
MPGLPLVVRETTHSGTLAQMCRQDSRAHLSPEEVVAAEESLSIYCKPVELYNILQRRALQNPSFLQRCLHYKVQAKWKRRIQMTVCLSENVNGVQPQNILPLYVILARPVSDIVAVAGHSAVYCLSRACILTASNEFERKDRTEANFVLPEINKLSAEIKAGELTILLVSCGDRNSSSCERSLLKEHLDMKSFPSNFGGYCLWGKIPMEPLYSSWEKCVNLNLGHRFDMPVTVAMHSSFLEASDLDEGNSISFKIPHNSGTTQLQVNISAQEVGAKERSPYNSYTYHNVPSSSLPHIVRLRTGNVIFNYKYYNNTLQKTEVTEDFSCPFCLVQCASFKGLRYHLCACHDLFNFEFWVTEEYQAVNVSVKTDIWRSEMVADGVDPRLQTFSFCSNPLRRRRSKSIFQNEKRVHPRFLKSDSPEVNGVGCSEALMDKNAGTSYSPMPIISPMDADPINQLSVQKFDKDARSSKERQKMPKAFPSETDWQIGRHNAESNGYVIPLELMERVTSIPNATGVSAATPQSSAGPECVQPVVGSNLAPPAMLQFAKTRKLSVERSDPRNRALLQKRQFFHSHRAQPMALEQVLSDRDSEDEVDDDIADFEDRRMLDDFVDVTKDEKQIMHLWNSFVRKQRVLADGHVPWACEAFSKLHGRDLVRAPALIWCWRLLMIKLWNHSLLDAHTMDKCNIILERYQSESSDHKPT